MKINLKKLLLWICLGFQVSWLLVDTMTGVLIGPESLDAVVFSPGALARICFFGLMIIILLVSGQKYVLLMLVFGVVIILLTIAHLLLDENLNVKHSIQTAIKVMMPLLILPVLKLQIAANNLTPRRARIIVYVNSAVLLLNLILGDIFKFGFQNYGERFSDRAFGTTGFFVAGNEVSATLLGLFTLTLICSKSPTVRFLFVVLYGWAALSIGSKTALFGLIVIVATFTIIYQTKKIIFLAITALFPLYFVLQHLLISRLDLTLIRYNYFSQKYGAVTVLLGGEKRLSHINYIIGNIYESPLKFFFGIGWTGLAENNFFDLLEGFGLFGISIFFFWFSRAFTQVKNAKKDYILFCGLSSFLLVTIAVLAGHVLQSAMLSLFFSIMLSKSTLDTLVNNR